MTKRAGKLTAKQRLMRDLFVLLASLVLTEPRITPRQMAEATKLRVRLMRYLPAARNLPKGKR